MSDTNQAHEIDAGDDDAAFEAGFASVHGSEPGSERSELSGTADDNGAEISTDEQPQGDAEAPAVEQQPEPQAEADPLDGLHPKVREALAELEQLRAVANRINRLEGSIGGLQSHVKQLASKPAPQPANGNAQAPNQEQASEEWKRIEEEFPEIAAAVDKRLRGVGGAAQIDPADLVGKVTEQVRADLDAKRQADSLAEIEEAHPAWGDAIKSEAGQAWLKTLPQHELQEFFTTERTSKVIRYLDRFAEHQQKQQQASSVQSRREATARNAITPQGGKAGVPRREMDEDAAFEAGFSSVRGVRSR